MHDRQSMHDRQKVEAILTRRFVGAPRGQIAAAANALMGLDDEWEEVVGDGVFGCYRVGKCAETCVLAQSLEDGDEFRLLRRRVL